MNDLKSNMDRFIGHIVIVLPLPNLHLKSNMDRFIVQANYHKQLLDNHLKSNMDRFIEYITKYITKDIAI